jgi:hypothetical protein
LDIFMRAPVLFIAFSFLFAAPGHAADDVAAVQTAIRSQEKAFGQDDAAAAYSYAGPPITSMYREAEIFMWMVRTLGNEITQQVHIIDADGVAWEALYTLQQQTDGSLKIISCVLSRAVGA